MTSTKVMSTLMNHAKFQTNIGGGVSRPASLAEIEALFAGWVAPFYVYDRRVKSGGSATRVIADTALLLLPAAVDPNACGSLTWVAPSGAARSARRQPNGTLPTWISRASWLACIGRKPPMIAEIVGDAIGMPVLANADLSFKATVVS